MVNSVSFWLVIVVVLSLFLVLNVALRYRRDRRRSRVRGQNPPARTFDARLLAPRLLEVRQDYLACLHDHSLSIVRRRNRLAEARERLAELEYFREHTGGGEHLHLSNSKV
jgi:hypothetical protein